MPELPEVETVRQTLRKHILGKTIAKVDVFLPRLVRQPDEVQEFKLKLEGLTIEEVGRRGKYLLIHVPPYTLVSHLRMEGKYSIHKAGDEIEKHTHLIFTFTDGTELRYKDVRQFGTFDLVPAGEFSSIPGLARLGPEPLDEAFTLEVFQSLLKRQTKRNMKALLLDQTFVAGLGNIYVDEALYFAKIHPERSVSSLRSEEIERLYEGIRVVLTTGIKAGGASVRTYRNSDGEMGYFQLQIQVYGKKGEPCPRCGAEIERIVVAGRGTHICPVCQKKE
jgi:formamidopyrimidine-DNA glycosylase